MLEWSLLKIFKIIIVFFVFFNLLSCHENATNEQLEEKKIKKTEQYGLSLKEAIIKFEEKRKETEATLNDLNAYSSIKNEDIVSKKIFLENQCVSIEKLILELKNNLDRVIEKADFVFEEWKKIISGINNNDLRKQEQLIHDNKLDEYAKLISISKGNIESLYCQISFLKDILKILEARIISRVITDHMQKLDDIILQSNSILQDLKEVTEKGLKISSYNICKKN